MRGLFSLPEDRRLICICASINDGVIAMIGGIAVMPSVRSA